jgi:hypothetical protein
MTEFFRIITLSLFGFGAGFLFFLNRLFKKENKFSIIGCWIFIVSFATSIVALICGTVIQLIIL